MVFGLLFEWLVAVVIILLGVMVVGVMLIAVCIYARFIRGLWYAMLGF